MEFLNRTYSQFQVVYRSMTPGSRMTTAALIAVAILSLGYLGLHQGSESLVDISRDGSLSAGQFAAIEEAFAKANLRGYEIQDNRIRVPRAEQEAFKAAMADAKISTRDFGDAQLDAVNSGSPLEIGTDVQHERMRIAKQIKLQNDICMRPGIKYAKVIFDVDNRPGGFKDKVMTALVSVKRGDGSQIDEATISAINGMVAHAYAGLKPENVAVSDLNGRTWYGDPKKNGNTEGNTYYCLKRTCEQDLKAKILEALCHIPNVTVGVNVELDRNPIPVVNPAPRSAATDDGRIQSSDPLQSNPGEISIGPTDVFPQSPNVSKAIDALLGGAHVHEKASLPAKDRSAAASQTETGSFAWAPLSARVSVGVPASYFKTVWQRRNPTEAGRPEKIPDEAALDRIRAEESANIQRCIVPLLPPPKGLGNAMELVTVTTFQDIPFQEPPPPGMGRLAMSWLIQNVKTLGLIGLILVCLLAIRSIVRNVTSVAAEQTPLSEDQSEDDSLTEEHIQAPSPHRKGQYSSAGSSLRDELSGFVEEDPEAAANILRNWIGQAS